MISTVCHNTCHTSSANPLLSSTSLDLVRSTRRPGRYKAAGASYQQLVITSSELYATNLSLTHKRHKSRNSLTMSETDLAGETATSALDPPPDSKPSDDLKTLLLSDESTVLGEEWVFGEILAVFSLFSDSVTAWVCRKEFVAQLTVEEMAMLKLSSASKRSEVVSLEIERMVLIWLQSQGPGRSKMKTAEYSRLLGYLQRPVWHDGNPLNPWDIEVGEKTVRLRRFLDSSYNTSNYRMTEIGTSSILCKTSLRGVCVQATCPFSHDVERARNKICKRFQNGICTSAEGCGNLHVLLHKQPS
ncbi:hypothetical protein DL95DRAFT_387871, partial [Leptodontidium sp. 2 PMI_412]